MKLRFYTKIQIADCIDREGNNIFLSAGVGNWFRVEIIYANTNKSSYFCEGLQEAFKRLGEEFGDDVVCSFRAQITSIARNEGHIADLHRIVDSLSSLPSQYGEEVNEC